MAIYAISDLHLALGADKPMDIFGARWANYMDRLAAAWEQTVGEEDHVLVPGDISWATYIQQAVEDFAYIDRLPGRKIISKGNHDYWWTTLAKMTAFFDEHGFKSISIMHNNCYIVENYAVCGTRGWNCPGDDGFGAEDRKIYLRELQRLELSLKEAGKSSGGREIIVALHYPPFNSKKEASGFVEIMDKFGVKKCIYGHLHGEGFKNAVTGEHGGISYHLVSSDFLNFVPIKLD